MRTFIAFLIVVLLFPVCYAGVVKSNNSLAKDIIIENSVFRLVIGSNGKALSLIHKPSGQECLQLEDDLCSDVPVFSITEYRPYNGEVHLVYPSVLTVYKADSVYRKGDDLIVSFDGNPWVATIAMKITDNYVGFTLKKLDYTEGFGDNTQHPIDEFTMLQLPVRNREYFGEWLNVIWDKDVAVNVLGTDPYAKISSEKYKGYTLLQAIAVREVKMIGAGAALIATAKDQLLDCIDHVEKDFQLPLGVSSRRNKEIDYSYLWLSKVSVKDIDEYIQIARKAGLRGIQIYWPAIFASLGHYPWRPEYPNGMADLQTIVRKIKEAGMIAGFHMQHPKASLNDLYVTPVPDHRLNLLRMFTLAEPIDERSATITVEENPEGCTLWDEKRILKIGNELIEYTGYSTERPYRFTGCKRGILGTRSSGYALGYKFGLLDMDGQDAVRFDQRSSIQQEHAERIAGIANEAGFRFFSYDGAEDVHPPWWFHVSMSQWEVHRRLIPEPLFSTGAAKSHFGWHILTCANEFDTFHPEVVKEATRKHQVAAAKYLAQDFTRVNFGWINYVAPGKETIGMQPDMYAYFCSRSVAWDCPISLKANMSAMKAHSRTPDNLETIRRWEEARINNLLTEEQKQAMRDGDQEYTLLINEKGKLEWQPYEQIPGVAAGDPNIRAFVFNRSGKTYIAYWHISGKANILLPVNAGKIRLFRTLGKKLPVEKKKEGVVIPANDIHYLETDLSRKEAIAAFQNAQIGQ